MTAATIALVRAFGDEPCRVEVKSKRDGSVWVYRESPADSIPYPRAYVYEWDADLFGKLARAFARRRYDELSALWRRARLLPVNERAH